MNMKVHSHRPLLSVEIMCLGYIWYATVVHSSTAAFLAAAYLYWLRCVPWLERGEIQAENASLR